MDPICCLTINCTEPHTHRLGNEEKQHGTKLNWLLSCGSPVSSTLQTWWGAEVPVLVASLFCRTLKVSIVVFIMVPKKMLWFKCFSQLHASVLTPMRKVEEIISRTLSWNRQHSTKALFAFLPPFPEKQGWQLTTTLISHILKCFPQVMEEWMYTGHSTVSSSAVPSVPWVVLKTHSITYPSDNTTCRSLKHIMYLRESLSEEQYFFSCINNGSREDARVLKINQKKIRWKEEGMKRQFIVYLAPASQ